MHISKRPIKRRGSMKYLLNSPMLEPVPIRKKKMVFVPTSNIFRKPLFDTEKYYYYFTEVYREKYRPM
jgi:hypothetical protein